MKCYYYILRTHLDDGSYFYFIFASKRSDIVRVLDSLYSENYSDETSLTFKTLNREEITIKMNDYDMYGSYRLSSKKKLFNKFKWVIEGYTSPEYFERIKVFGFPELSEILNEKIKEFEHNRYNPLETYAKAMSFVAECLEGN